MRFLRDWTGPLGIILLAAGFATSQARPAWRLPGSAGMLLGVLVLLVSVYANFDRIRSFFSRRTARYSVNVALMILLVVGIIALVEAVSFRHNWRLDLTENRRHSLSPQTIQLLRTLKGNVSATAFFRTDQPNKRTAEDLLKQYAYYSGGKFSWQVVDPDRNPGLAKRYGVETYGTVVLETKDKEEKVTDAEEEKLTNGLVRVTREGKRTVYVLKGHGERDLTSSERSGLTEAKTAMEKANYQVKDLLMLRDPKVPDDASIVVVPGPKTDLLPPELETLGRFIARGGKVLFMVDPFQSQAAKPFLAKYGIELGDNVIIDISPIGRLFGAGPEIPAVTQYESHPITKGFNVATFFPLTRTVEVAAKPPDGVTVQSLGTTGPESWAETNREEINRGQVKPDPGERRGPLSVAAVATVPATEGEAKEKGAKARVVVFGTSGLATNQFLNVQGNKDFFLNTISWLAEEEDLIAIRPKESRSTPIFLTAQQAKLVFWIPVVGLPGAILVAGVTVVRRHRRSS